MPDLPDPLSDALAILESIPRQPDETWALQQFGPRQYWASITGDGRMTDAQGETPLAAVLALRARREVARAA